MKKLYIIIIMCFSIISLFSACANSNPSLFQLKKVVEEPKTMVPNLPDDYPDYYAKCLKCGHIWTTQSEEMCNCGNFDNVEVYNNNIWKNSKLYRSLPQEDLLYADCDGDISTITIGFRDDTQEYHKYRTNDEFLLDLDILYNGCGPAEYIYHSKDEGTQRHIIYYPKNTDVIQKHDNEVYITYDNTHICILEGNVE